MQNDFEELLNSLGVSIPDDTINIRADSNFEGFHPASADRTPSEAETPAPARELSESDISEILENNGYQETPEADAEEITEEEMEWNILEPAQNTVAGVPIIDPTRTVAILEPNVVQDLASIEEQTQEIVGIPADAIRSSVADTEETEIQDAPFEDEESSEDTPLIPENSPTLIIDDSTARFSGAEWYDEIQMQSIILAGLGGIGSNVALQVARMKPNRIVLYDPDKVETVNMSGQLYQHCHINKYKVDACADQLRKFTNAYSIYAVRERYNEHREAGPVMMCGFDNMEARKVFFNKWKMYVQRQDAEEREKCLYLDGRLSIDTLQVFCIRGDDEYYIKKYEDEYLFSDNDADETICSMKQTTYLACMIGSIMTNLFTNFVASTLHPAIPYNLPFFTEYEAQSMKFKTENVWHL